MIATMFEEMASKRPDQRAVTCGSESIDYYNLNSAAHRVARYMRRRGFCPGDRAGILGRNSIEWVIALLGILKAGGTPVNLNYRYTAPELQKVLNDVDPRWLFHDGDLKVMDEVYGWDMSTMALDNLEHDVSRMSFFKARLCRDSTEPHYMLMTGGTTGPPKAVLWNQRDFIKAHLSSDMEAWTVAVLSPLMQGTAQTVLLTALLKGRHCILYEGSFDADKVWDLIGTEHPQVVVIVGDAMARPMLSALEGRSRGYRLLLVSAGAQFSEDVRMGFIERGINALDAYGSTETGSGGVAVGPRRFMLGPDFGVLVEGDDGWRLADVGEHGRIACWGPKPVGYFNDVDLTDENFVTADFARWVVTRDVGYRNEDGSTTLLGRIDNCINTGGMKVWAEEVEESIKSFLGVTDAIVYGQPDEEWGEKVSCVFSGDVDSDRIYAHISQRLAGFKLPKVWQRMDVLPRTEAGKPDYAKLVGHGVE
jgi:acyl-CoA synthetase (AMP-forming)/AMP-acid ligase II